MIGLRRHAELAQGSTQRDAGATFKNRQKWFKLCFSESTSTNIIFWCLAQPSIYGTCILVGFNVPDPAMCAVYLPELRERQFKWFKKGREIVKDNGFSDTCCTQICSQTLQKDASVVFRAVCSGFRHAGAEKKMLHAIR